MYGTLPLGYISPETLHNAFKIDQELTRMASNWASGMGSDNSVVCSNPGHLKSRICVRSERLPPTISNSFERIPRSFRIMYFISMLSPVYVLYILMSVACELAGSNRTYKLVVVCRWLFRVVGLWCWWWFNLIWWCYFVVFRQVLLFLRFFFAWRVAGSCWWNSMIWLRFHCRRPFL